MYIDHSKDLEKTVYFLNNNEKKRWAPIILCN